MRSHPSAPVGKPIESGLIFATRSEVSGGGVRTEDQKRDDESVKRGQLIN